ncbi:MAG: hypothetical protein NTZ80_03705 [Patescibacteria group bacterium]|nr:hypothetical protein [Patescibacteria group bacterium]
MFESKDALQLHSLFYKHFKEGANAKEQAQNFMKSIFELRSSGSENSTTVTRIRSKSYDLSNSQDKANYDATMAKINASRFANSVIHEDIVDKDGTTWHKIDYIDYNPRDLIKVMKERSDGTIEIDKEEMLKEWSPAKLAHWKDSIDNFFEKFVINKNLEGLKDKKFIASLFRTVREAVNKGVITGEDLLKMGGLQRIMADMTAEDNNPTQFWDKIQFPEPEKRTEFQAAGKEIDEKYKEANKKKKEEAAARREAQGGSGSDANDGWSWPAPSGGGGNRGDSGGSGSSGGSGGGEARRHDDDNSQARPTSITAKIDPKDFESWYDILENTLAHLTENYLMQAQRVGRDTKTALQGVAANFDELFKQVLGKLEGSHEEQVDTIRTQFEGLQGEMADLHRSINDSVYDEESKFEGIRDNIKECAERTDAAVGDLLDRVQYLKDKAKETGEGVEAIEEAVLP